MEAQPIKELADIFQKGQPFNALVAQPDWQNIPNNDEGYPVANDIGLWELMVNKIYVGMIGGLIIGDASGI